MTNFELLFEFIKYGQNAKVHCIVMEGSGCSSLYGLLWMGARHRGVQRNLLKGGRNAGGDIIKVGEGRSIKECKMYVLDNMNGKA